jgi:hypothetical protein
MVRDEEQENPGIKVVDRRRFDDEGDDRAQTPSNGGAEPPKRVVEAPPTTAHTSTPLTDEPAPRDDQGDFTIDFAAFIESLAQQALMHMGVLPYPETGERRRELTLARQTIDILQMLHEKTQGNLTSDEKKLFDAVLHDLRLAFVTVNQAAPKK